MNLTEYIVATGPKHCSFDFWDTIVRSNPAFKWHRNELLAKRFSVAEEKIVTAFADVGRWYNQIQEQSKGYRDPASLLSIVLKRIDVDVSNAEVDENFQAILNLFTEHPPVIIPSTESAIRKCIEMNVKLSIVSNTAFIPGSQIRTFLDSSFGEDTFVIQLYSDEQQLAKPNPDLFRRSYEMICERHRSPLAIESILHVGDKTINDYEAAKFVGMDAYVAR